MLPGAWSRAVSRRSAALALVVVAARSGAGGGGRARRAEAVSWGGRVRRWGAACTRTEYRYHLAQRGYWEHHLKPTRDCSLDVANEGPRTLDEVAEAHLFILFEQAQRNTQLATRSAAPRSYELDTERFRLLAERALAGELGSQPEELAECMLSDKAGTLDDRSVREFLVALRELRRLSP